MPLPSGHPLETYLLQWQTQLSWANYYQIYLSVDTLTLGPQIQWADPIGGPIAWAQFRSDLINFCQVIAGEWWLPDQYPQVEFCYNEYDYWTGISKMSDILQAMLKATYDELQMFIGIEDAYRSAIWDKPFNAQFYAALANGFRQ